MFASGKTAAVASAANYVEECFSTYLYTGNSPSTQTITNGIDLSGKGGMVWVKSRVSGDGSNYNNILMDTARGTGSGNILYSNLTSAAQTAPNAGISSFNSNGFSLRYDDGYGTNYPSGGTFASWTFRKQPKFFDVVTLSYTSGAAVFNHSLGSVPGFVILKVSSGYSDNWWVYHRSLGNDQYINLNLTSAAQTSTGIFSATDTTFTVKNGIFSASTIVAYLFAHNAGGFGLTGTDNVISCGSYTGTGSVGPSVNLGYEPQWLLIKRATGTSAISGWYLLDNMRGIPLSGGSNYLRAETSDAETNNSYAYATPTATGFNVDPGGVGLTGVNFSGETYIYIAIRRGPMKVPTSGTSVFSNNLETSSANPQTLTTGFPVDMNISTLQTPGTNKYVMDRLRGSSVSSGVTLYTNSTTAELATSGLGFQNNTGLVDNGWWNTSGAIFWSFGRAPSFFDEVCYTGTEVSGQTFNHNLGVVPEMMIVKARDGTTDWTVYHSALGASARIYLNATNAANTGTAAPWNSTTPTSTVFSLGNAGATNLSGTKFVNYLFATCAGVSKCTAFTGTGTLQTINCGFTAGSRFVLIKRTDAAGDWYVWDSSRGLSSSTDPYLLLNSAAAEVTSTNWVDTTSTGFQVTAASGNNVNINGASYIALAIA